MLDVEIMDKDKVTFAKRIKIRQGLQNDKESFNNGFISLFLTLLLNLFIIDGNACRLPETNS